MEYNAWAGMIQRCFNENDPSYHRYGGRGITVAPTWRASFAAFLVDVGPKPSPEHSLDRYPNNDGNYEPGNVRWATRAEQLRNKRSNVNLTVEGVTQCLEDWAAVSGLSPLVIRRRLNKGWDSKRAIFEPLTKAAVLKCSANLLNEGG